MSRLSSCSFLASAAFPMVFSKYLKEELLSNNITVENKALLQYPISLDIELARSI
jgi:hypothetical protein